MLRGGLLENFHHQYPHMRFCRNSAIEELLEQFIELLQRKLVQYTFHPACNLLVSGARLLGRSRVLPTLLLLLDPRARRYYESRGRPPTLPCRPPTLLFLLLPHLFLFLSLLLLKLSGQIFDVLLLDLRQSLSVIRAFLRGG